MIVPTGKLIPIGGKEAKGPNDEELDDYLQPVDFHEGGILQEVLSEIKGTASRILIIPAASSIPQEMGPLYLDAFANLGCHQVEVVYFEDPAEADHPDNLRRLEEADGVLFTGGDQVKLTEKLSGTAFARRLKERYEREGFVVAGTSAGAMAMSGYMIREGDSAEPLLKGIVDTGKGLGLLPQAIVDTHFMNRGRLARLTEALLRHPECVALGISEDTGLVIGGNGRMRAIGSGVVIVIEANEAGETNYHEAEKHEPVYIENLRLHILARGACYSITDRRFITESDNAS